MVGVKPEQSATSPLAIGAIASTGAAIIHAVASGIHADHPTLARIFIVLAVAQAVAAVLGFLRHDRWACGAILAVNGAAVVGWLVTRVVGVSRIDGLQVVERPQIADTTAAVLAMVAVVTATTCVLGRGAATTTRGLTRAAALTVVLVVPGLADASTHDHAAVMSADHSGNHDHSTGDDDHGDTIPPVGGVASPSPLSDPAIDAGGLPESEVAAIIELGATGAGPPPDHDHGASHPSVELDQADQAAVDAEVAFARSSVTEFDTVEEAEALGYILATVPSPGIGTHWVRWSQILEPFDLRTPSMLLFDHTRSPPVLVGYSYALQSDTVPVGFTGDSDHWHRHTGMCVRLDGWVVGERIPGPEACDGSFIAGGDFWMLHAWVVPGWDNRDGVFAPMNPKLCPRPVGIPDYLHCPDEAPL